MDSTSKCNLVQIESDRIDACDGIDQQFRGDAAVIIIVTWENESLQYSRTYLVSYLVLLDTLIFKT